MSDLDLLLAEGIIDEICGRLKSGKEADISAVRRGDQILAAKVYKDRATRSFKNNADYKEGRKVRNTRTQRAIDSGGKFGRDSEEQAWKSAEADALYKLAGTGVRVPAPVMFYEGVLLMELVAGADGQVAPRLIDVAIPPDDAMGIYADLLSQMISMLCCDLIHGDLSPYNILYAADGPTIIDFPQVISAAHNTRAEFFFLRDFDNVLRFLVGFDASLAIHRADGRAVWRAYVARELTPQFVPPPPPPPQQQRREERRFRDRDNRGSQRTGPRFEQGEGRGPPQSGSQPRFGGPSRDGRAPSGDASRFDDRRRDDGRRPNGGNNRAPQQRNDGRRNDGGVQQRNDGPRTDRRSQPRIDDRSRNDGPRNDGQRAGRRSQPRIDDRPRNDGTQPRIDGPRNDRRSQPRIDNSQPNPRRYGDRFNADRPPDRSSETDRPRNDGPRNDGPRGDRRSQPRIDVGPQSNPRRYGDRFANTDRPPDRSSDNDRPRTFAMPPPRTPRPRVDPRPPPPSGGHRRRPKRRS